MVENEREKPQPIANAETEHYPEQQADQQNWKRGLIHLGGGGGITGACYAGSRLFDEPYNGWIIALGFVCAIVTTGFVFHDFYPRKRGPITAIVMVCALLVLLGIGKWTESVWEKRGTLPEMNSLAQFQPPRFEPAITRVVNINVGTNIAGLLRSRLATCAQYIPGSPYPFPLTVPAPLMLDGLDPVSVCVDNNRIFVNVRLSDDTQSGNQAEIIHDHFTIEPNNWDWNFDDEAFEAVDENQQPVLQLIYRSPSEILIRGVFISRGAAWVLTDRGMIGDIPLADLPRVRAMPEQQIKRIFKYPHEKYPRVRE